MDNFLNFGEFSLLLNFLFFVIAALVTWFAGSKLSSYGVVIADRTNIDQSLMGFIVIAAATSLPELVITITGSISGNANLVLNDMFGGISMQTAIIAVADMIVIAGPITFYAVQSSLLIEASLLILVLSFTLAVISIKNFFVFSGIGFGAIIVTLLYVLCIYILNKYHNNKQWIPIEISSQEKEKISNEPGVWLDQKRPLREIIGLFLLNTLLVLVASIILVKVSIVIAAKSGLGDSFVGATLLAATTSLPELSVTITAASMGAYSMAISNIFGSNMIMFALIMPAEIFYRQGAILQEADESVIYAIISGIFLTSIYLVGLIARRKNSFMNMGLDSILVVVFYLITLVVFYGLR